MSMMTPDGLIIYEQPGVGLVVSAAEHNCMLSKWESERASRAPVAAKQTTTKPACKHATIVNVREFIYDQVRCSECGAYLGEPFTS